MGALQRFVDSFRMEPAPAPLSKPIKATAAAVPTVRSSADLSRDASVGEQELEKKPDLEGQAESGKDGEGGIGMPTTTDESGLKRNLTQRHMQMIAFGGAIGTGLFVGSGGVYTTGGPGFLVLDYILVGIMLFCVVMSLGELASVLPVSGSFATYSTRFLSPSWGFAMGWNYWMQWYITLPLELVAASIVIRFWDPEQKITPGVWIIIFMIAIVIINLFGVRGYGEFEFGAALIKIMAVIGFIIAGIVISCGGGPSHEYIGAKFWHTEQGAFFNGFQGFCSVFVSASFAFSGTELIGLAAAETANPRKEVPKAAKQIFARILIFYCVSLFIVTLTVDPTDARLTGGSSNYDARQSPFVIAIDRAQIKALPSVINAVILVSVLSVGNSSVYAGSRTLLALAQAGQAPRIFSYIDRHGRPLPAVLLSLAIGFLAFLIYSTSQTDVFNWLLGLSGLSVIFSWASISFCHVRFRAAWKRAGHTLEELPWKSPIGIFGAWYGGLFCILVVILQMIIAVWPIGSEEMTTSARVVVFFQSCLALPVVILFYCIGEALWHDGWIQVEDIDISTGRREPVPVDILRREREEAKATPIYKQVWSLFF